jgi:hypothetical protein
MCKFSGMKIQLKRAYDSPSKSDGTRILVDLDQVLHYDGRFEHAGIAVRAEKGHDFVERNLTIDK